MTDRKLTKKQQRVITNKQANISDDANIGVIICHYGKYVDIEDQNNQFIRCHIRQNLPDLAVGDQVNFEVELHKDIHQQKIGHPCNGVITNLLPRHSLLSRSNIYKARIKPIAANLDQMLIIFAPKPEPQSYLIDQFLIIAESCDIPAVLIFNKSDLYSKASSKIEQLFEIYKNIGYPIIKVSSVSQNGMDGLNQVLLNKNSIFVGQSGVGKSTLTKNLITHSHDEKEAIKTSAISEKSELGKHTTSASRLYHIHGDQYTNLIDSPGIREMGVAHLSKPDLEHAYIEFRPYLGKCKFRDCAHEKEPSCALKEALEQGKISQMRWDNYKKFVE